MKRYLLTFAIGFVAISTSSTAEAAIVQFNLFGNAGAGLLPGNEVPAVVASGFGGETAPGITFDDDTNDLIINVAWGSANGFGDLTGTVTGAHLHQVSVPGSGIGGAGGVIIPLSLSAINNGATNGFISQTVNLTPTQEIALLAGDTYLNFHTAANAGGEIRGNLVAVPEPGSVLAIVAISTGCLLRRGRRRG